MATPTQLSGKLDTLFKSISTKISSKLDLSSRATDSSKLEGKTLAQVGSSTVTDALAQVNGRKGEMAFFNQDGTPMALEGGEMVIQLRMASDDAAINTLKSATVSFQDIFNKWGRISHSNQLIFPHNVTEMNSWSYDEPTDSVMSTVNSGTMIGLISPDRFDQYTFETSFKSTNGDDDTIGMCAAFKKVGAREYTVSVLVSPRGMNPDGSYNTTGTPRIWCTVNYNQGVANGMVVLWTQELGIVASSWNAGEIAAGIKVKIVRRAGGLLEITSTRPDGSPWPNPVFATVQLPVMFLSKCSIGYLATSQPASTWLNFQVPTAKTDIVDTRDMTVWRWNNTTGTWVNAGKMSNPAVMIPGRIYKNTQPPLYEAYYLDFDGNLVTIGKPSQL